MSTLNTYHISDVRLPESREEFIRVVSRIQSEVYTYWMFTTPDMDQDGLAAKTHQLIGKMQWSFYNKPNLRQFELDFGKYIPKHQWAYAKTIDTFTLVVVRVVKWWQRVFFRLEAELKIPYYANTLGFDVSNLPPTSDLLKRFKNKYGVMKVLVNTDSESNYKDTSRQSPDIEGNYQGGTGIHDQYIRQQNLIRMIEHLMRTGRDTSPSDQDIFD